MISDLKSCYQKNTICETVFKACFVILLLISNLIFLTSKAIKNEQIPIVVDFISKWNNQHKSAK